MKRVFLFANAFPFGSWEPFLETEIEAYGPFDRVDVFSLSVRPEQLAQRRPIDLASVHVHPVPFRSRGFYALRAVRALADPEFYRDLRRLIADRGLTPARLVALLVFLSRCHHEAAEISRIITQENLAEPGDEIVLYSYRVAYQPYLAELVRRRLRGVRTVRIARAHGSDLYEDANPPGYIPLRRATGDVLEQVYCVSEHGLDHARSVLGWSPEKTSVSYLGCRDAAIGAAARATADPAADPTADLARRTLRLVSAAVVVPLKRIERIVEALALLDGVEVEWTHYGDGPQLEQVRSAAAGLGENITVDLRGQVPNSEVLRAFAEDGFHALVSLSSSEGLPVSMMEAMSCGLPVVSTDVGGVSEIVHDGENGFLLAADPEASDVALALTSIADMQDSCYEELARNARRTWAERFSAQDNYSRFVGDLLRKLS